MKVSEKIAKAKRIKAKLIADHGKDSDFAEAMALWMVLNNEYKIKRATMAAFLAGPNASERLRRDLHEGTRA